jgi:hypothetical protein
MPSIEFQRDMDFPAARVWALLEDFGNMSWAPGVKNVEIIGAGIGMTRRLHMDGMDPIDEVLETQDPATMSFSYSIPRGIPLPVTDYLAGARIESTGGNTCRVHWHGSCTPTDPSMSGEDLEAMLHSTYNLLLDMLDTYLRDKQAS